MNMDATQTKHLIFKRMTRGLKWEIFTSKIKRCDLFRMRKCYIPSRSVLTADFHFLLWLRDIFFAPNNKSCQQISVYYRNRRCLFSLLDFVPRFYIALLRSKHQNGFVKKEIKTRQKNKEKMVSNFTMSLARCE